jgi:hypothetical protein
MAGQSMTEFLIIFPLLIMLVFGIIQFALIYQARATLNHATLLAARAGALHNGNKLEMRKALAKGLVPLFAKEPDMVSYGNALLLDATPEVMSNMTEISVLNPTRAALADFGRARIDNVGGRELPSDTLSYRNSNPGASSGISVQDANLLHLRVSYCFRLVVPVMSRVIHAGANALTPFSAALSANGMHDPFGTRGVAVPSLDCMNPLFRGPRIVIRSEAIVRMQSHFFESNL